MDIKWFTEETVRNSVEKARNTFDTELLYTFLIGETTEEDVLSRQSIYADMRVKVDDDLNVNIYNYDGDNHGYHHDPESGKQTVIEIPDGMQKMLNKLTEEESREVVNEVRRERAMDKILKQFEEMGFEVLIDKNEMEHHGVVYTNGIDAVIRHTTDKPGLVEMEFHGETYQNEYPGSFEAEGFATELSIRIQALDEADLVAKLNAAVLGLKQTADRMSETLNFYLPKPSFTKKDRVEDRESR